MAEMEKNLLIRLAIIFFKLKHMITHKTVAEELVGPLTVVGVCCFVVVFLS